MKAYRKRKQLRATHEPGLKEENERLRKLEVPLKFPVELNLSGGVWKMIAKVPNPDMEWALVRMGEGPIHRVIGKDSAGKYHLVSMKDGSTTVLTVNLGTKRWWKIWVPNSA